MTSSTTPQDSATPPRPSEGPKVFGALQRYPEFRYVCAHSLLSFTGVWVQMLVMAWLTYEITRSTFLLALFTMVRMSPLLLGPLGGLLADRWDRVYLLISGQVMLALAVVALALLVATDAIAYWHLLVGGFMLGLGGAPLQPARMTLVTDIVRREHLTNAIAQIIVAFDVTGVFGPGLSGIVIEKLGAATALWMAAAWYVVAGLSLAPVINLGKRFPRKPSASPWRDMLAGFRMVLGNRLLLAVLSITVSTNFLAWSVYQTFMPVFAKDILQMGAGGLGTLFTAAGVGQFLGAVGISALGDFRWKGKLYVLGTGTFGVLLGLFALSKWFTLSLGLIMGAGLFSAAFGVMQTALLMALVPAELRSRAFGVQILFIGVLPLGTLIMGAIAGALGAATTPATGVVVTTSLAGFLLAANMLALFIWVPSLRRLP